MTIGAKMLHFSGVNHYVLSEDCEPECEIAANMPVPCSLHAESPLRGAITFSEVLPTANDGCRVVVNVDTREPALTSTISSRSVIYIGGTYDEPAIVSALSSSCVPASQQDDGMLFSACSNAFELGRGGSDLRLDISSFRWARTYVSGNCGRNVANWKFPSFFPLVPFSVPATSSVYSRSPLSCAANTPSM